MRTILDPDMVERGIRRMAGHIVERAQGAEGLGLVGVRRGGVPIAERLAAYIRELEGKPVPVGAVDIALYRDDASTALPNPQIGRTEIPFAVEGCRVVLVDDVLYTGRTIRAALDAILDYGRPKTIELAVLVDRGGRELPIQPDYVVKAIEVGPNELVEVASEGAGLRAVVTIAERRGPQAGGEVSSGGAGPAPGGASSRGASEAGGAGSPNHGAGGSVTGPEKKR